VSARASCSIEDMFDNRWFDFRDFPYLSFFNGETLVRFGERESAVLTGLWLVMNGLRDLAWQCHGADIARMTFLAARLSAGSATWGFVSSFPVVIL